METAGSSGPCGQGLHPGRCSGSASAPDSDTADSGSRLHPLAAHSQELQIKEGEKRIEKREENV